MFYSNYIGRKNYLFGFLYMFDGIFWLIKVIYIELYIILRGKVLFLRRF